MRFPAARSAGGRKAAPGRGCLPRPGRPGPALAQAHYGAAFTGRNLPANWHSTGNALERQAFIAKDALLTVDDFAPGGTAADVQRLYREAERLLRAQGNRAGRLRMRDNTSLRPEFYPRGLILSSGEDIPIGQSLRARLLILEVAGDAVDLASLTRAQASAGAGLLARSMAGYLRWLAPRIEELKRSLPEEHRKLRQEARGCVRGHDRTPDAMASLSLGWRWFLAFALDCGAITPAERNAAWKRGWEALSNAAAAQAGHQASEEPTARFLEMVISELASGAAHVADAVTEGSPPKFKRWGWRAGRDGPEPQGNRIGWLKDGDLLLLPNPAFAFV